MAVKSIQIEEKIEKEHCTGCAACENICPANCIEMNTDEEGFLYPVTDARLCSECGKCLSVCPVINPILSSSKHTKVYAAWSLDVGVRYQSTSGGIFTELAKAVINDGGSVAAARYGKQHHMIYHAIINRVGDLSLLRQSKYVQSHIGKIYKDILDILKADHMVLFVGTPCQCVALYNIAGNYKKLILCDFICRGVNSPLVFAQYLEELSSVYNDKVRQVWFKNKEQGWNAFGTKVLFKNGAEYFGARDTDPFMYGYIKSGLNLYMRPSCAKCEFKGIDRPTDITLADFWGVKLKENEDDQRNGVSAVMINSEDGYCLFEKVEPYIYCEEQSLDAVHSANECLTKSAVYNSSNRAQFWSKFHKEGFHAAMRQFMKT